MKQRIRVTIFVTIISQLNKDDVIQWFISLYYKYKNRKIFIFRDFTKSRIFF